MRLGHGPHGWRLRSIREGCQLGQPRAALAEGALNDPEIPMRSAESEPHRRFALVHTPAQRRPQVVPLQLERGVSCLATRPADVRVVLPPFGEGLEPDSVLVSNGVQLSRSFESLVGVLADGLQQPVAGPPVPLVDLNQGRVHQSGEQAEHFLRRNSAARADLLRGLQAPAADEHRQPSKDDLLGWREQPVAPVERGPHGLLATRR